MSFTEPKPVGSELIQFWPNRIDPPESQSCDVDCDGPNYFQTSLSR
jgi:hypothetical protein